MNNTRDKLINEYLKPLLAGEFTDHFLEFRIEKALYSLDVYIVYGIDGVRITYEQMRDMEDLAIIKAVLKIIPDAKGRHTDYLDGRLHPHAPINWQLSESRLSVQLVEHFDRRRILSTPKEIEEENQLIELAEKLEERCN